MPLEVSCEDNIALLSREQFEKTISDAKVFGMLAHRANPDLWAEEETAYAKAVISKYNE